MAAAGGRPVTEIAGTPPAGRRLLARLLREVPSQGERAARLGVPPHLVVLEKSRPAMGDTVPAPAGP
jgi:hypothetical protein